MFFKLKCKIAKLTSPKGAKLKIYKYDKSEHSQYLLNLEDINWVDTVYDWESVIFTMTNLTKFGIISYKTSGFGERQKYIVKAITPKRLPSKVKKFILKNKPNKIKFY